MNKVIFLLIIFAGNICQAASQEPIQEPFKSSALRKDRKITTEQFVEEVLSLAKSTKNQSADKIQKKLDGLKLPTKIHAPSEEKEDEVLLTEPHVLRLIYAFEKLHVHQFIAELDCFIPERSKTYCFEQFKKRLIVKLSPWMIKRIVQRINKKLEGETCIPGIELDLKQEEQCAKNKAIYKALKKKKVFDPFITYLQSLEHKGFVTQHDINQLPDVQQAIQRRVEKVITSSLLEVEGEDGANREVSTIKDLIMQWYKREAIKVQELVI